MIEQELNSLIHEQAKHRNTPKPEHSRINHSGSKTRLNTIKTYVNGDIEEEEIDEDCSGNPAHSATTGLFVNPDKEKGSWSKLDKSCPKHGQRRRPKASKYSVAIPVNRKPCGRGSKWRCRDSSPKWQQESLHSISEEDAGVLTGVDIATLHGIIQQELSRLTKQPQARCSVEFCAKVIQMLSSAEKGELYKQQQRT